MTGQRRWTQCQFAADYLAQPLPGRHLSGKRFDSVVNRATCNLLTINPEQLLARRKDSQRSLLTLPAPINDWRLGSQSHDISPMICTSNRSWIE